MLQRIQTIYLVLAFICSLLLLFFPIFYIAVIDAEGIVLAASDLGAYGILGDTVQTMPLYLLFVLTAMLSLIAIFLFKNRKKQLLFSRLNLVLQILVAITFLSVYFFGFDFIAKQYSELSHSNSNISITIGLGYYLLFLGIPFILLAIRGIRSDEALLKSLDRLR